MRNKAWIRALALALIAMLCAATALAEGALSVKSPEAAGTPAGVARTSENALGNVDELSQALGLTEEERELLMELDPSEQVHIEDGDLSISTELGDGWRNILLMGNDSRSLDDNGRTDTMIIASVNQQTGEVKLTSIMRDTVVKIPGKSKKNKINAAYRYGGPNLAMKTVNEAFDLNIKEYAVVNLAGFAEIIDAVGGLNLDISRDEMLHINNIMGYYEKDAKKNGLAEGKDFTRLDKYGENTHLNGQQALAYSRIRKLDTDDRRTERQRTVLTALGRKLADMSAGDLMSTGLKLWGNIRTNIGFFDAMQLGLKAASALSDDDLKQFRIPANGTYKSGTFDGRWEIHANLEKNARLLHEFIYE